MNFIKFFIPVLFMHHAIAAQSDYTPEMKYWDGGKIGLKIDLGLNSIGTSGGYGTFMGIISPRANSGAFSLYGNPAELGLLLKNQIGIDTKIGISSTSLGIGADDIISRETIREHTDSFLNESTTFFFNAGDSRRTDTQIDDLNIGQKGQISALTAGVPISRYLTLGLGFTYPVDISVNFTAGGVKTNFESVKQTAYADARVDIELESSLVTDMRIRMSTLSFGAGSRLLEGNSGTFTMGISVNRYSTSNTINLDMNGWGSVRINGENEYFFNDSEDSNLDREAGETNNLYWKARGNFQTVNWGFRIGAFYNSGKFIDWLSFLGFSVVADIIPDIRLSDNGAFSDSYQPKFLTGRYTGNGADELMVNIDSLNLDKPNLTRKTYNNFSDEVLISIPGSVTLGIDAAIGEQTIAVNFVKYLKDFSYQFDKYKIGKKADFGIKAGVDIKLPDELSGWSWTALPFRLLFLDLDGLLFQLFGGVTGYKNPHYRIGGGVLFGDNILEGIESEGLRSDIEELLSLPVPTNFNFGRSYTLLGNLDVNVMLIGVPDVAMRFSLGYNF